MNAVIKSYDRQEDETIKAYAAFCIYRDLGVDRALKTTSEKYYSVECPQNVRRAKNMRQIEVWSSKYKWIDRCKDYDRDREGEQRDRQRELDRAEHDRKLEQFRQDNESLGRGLLAIGGELMVAINQLTKPARDKLKSKGELGKYEAEQLMQAPSAIRSIALFVQTGNQMNADGLLIRQLMEKLKEGGE